MDRFMETVSPVLPVGWAVKSAVHYYLPDKDTCVFKMHICIRVVVVEHVATWFIIFMHDIRLCFWIYQLYKAFL